MGIKSIWWMHYLHLFEGVSMLCVGPFFMAFPSLILSLYEVDTATPTAVAIVPWFGALVTLMGYHQSMCWKQLTKAWIEACLLADVLWIYAFISFVNSFGKWNLWSLAGSLTWTIAFAPLRAYWLWGVPTQYRPPVR